MRKRLSFFRALLVRCTDDDHGITVAVQLHILGNFGRDLDGLVSDGRQELVLAEDCAIVVRENKIAVQHFPHGVRVVIDLHLVPQILQRDDFRLVTLGNGNVLQEGHRDECKQENETA